MPTLKCIVQICFFQFAVLGTCNCQSSLKFRDVNFSELKRFWYLNKSIDKEPLFYFEANGKRFACSKQTGLVYVFDLNNEKLTTNKSEIFTDGYVDSRDYYTDDAIIAWRKKNKNDSDRDFVLKVFNLETNESALKVFDIPQKLLRTFKSVILDTNRVLVNNLIFYSHGKSTPDTLKNTKEIKFPEVDDHTLMRRSLYVSDPCFNSKERCSQNFLGLSFSKLNEKLLTTFSINPKNIPLPIGTYRVESEYKGIIFLSNKIDPNKFLLYEISTQKTYIFTLDSSIFNAKRLKTAIPNDLASNHNDEYPPSEIDFRFNCTMDGSNIYITVVFRPDNEVKVFRIEDYRSIMH